MKISVITINLNNRNGLVKTFESVISQTVFSDIEYIVVDGGSTDGSVDVINGFEHFIDYSISESDNGIYDAMNKGINSANGDYCIFLNSGDYFYSRTSVEEMLPHLTEDIVYGNLMLDGERVKKYVDKIPQNYFDYESLPHPSSFIRTSILKEKKYNTSYKIISDWIFFKERIIKEDKTYKHVDVTVSNYDTHGVSSNVKRVMDEKADYANSLTYDCEISIVIPLYNQEKYVEETIKSLKESTYKDFVCIVVNDGSTDNSEEKALKAIDGDERFKYFKNENHGQSYTRNFGISKTNSKYILPLDSDDKISPTYIENGVKYLNGDLDTSLYYGKAKMFNDDGNEKDWSLPKFSYSLLLRSNLIYSCCIYRRKDFNRIGGYDEEMNGYEDWDFLIRLLYKNDKVYRTDDVVFYYRRHEGSMDTVARKNIDKYKEYIRAKNKDIYASYTVEASKDLDMFISTDRPFPIRVSNPTYKILIGNHKIESRTKREVIRCKLNTELDDSFYGEIYMYKWLRDNYKLKKYVGFCHYNRYFAFLDKIPNMEKEFSKSDILIPKPIPLNVTNKEVYEKLYNIKDLNIIEDIITNKYPQMSDGLNGFLKARIMIPYNMFVMRKEDFIEYVDFVWDVLEEYLKVVGNDIDKRIEDNKNEYIKDFYPSDKIEYQKRIGKHLTERLTNIFIMYKFKKFGVSNIIIEKNEKNL